MRSLVDSLFDQLILRSEVVATLKGDPSLDDTARQAALSLAEVHWQESATQLNDASWKVVKAPGADPAAYRLALRRAEAACRLEPEEGAIVNTLGVAQYRAGMHKEAVDTLLRAEKLHQATSPNTVFWDVVFLAMARWQLGHKDRARADLDRARELLKKMGDAAGEEIQGFLREAEGLLKKE